MISPDVPSGIDSTTGEAAGAHVQPLVTLTLALPKTGLDVPAVGSLCLADIGISRDVYRRVGVSIPDRIFEAGCRMALQPA